MVPSWVYHCLYVHFNHTKAISASHGNIPEGDRSKFFAVTLGFINESISLQAGLNLFSSNEPCQANLWALCQLPGDV